MVTMQLAEYLTLDRAGQQQAWAGMAPEEQAQLKAEKQAMGGAQPQQPQAAPAAPAGAIADDAVNQVSNALGGTVGKLLKAALIEAASKTRMTPDDVVSHLAAGGDLGDMGVEMTPTLKVAVSKLQAGRKAAPAAALPTPPPAAAAPAGGPQAASADLLGLMGGA
jgi:hypothetical protein